MANGNCTARIRPFPNDTEVRCERYVGGIFEDSHTEHEGVVRDYAYPGSATRMTWLEGDRRNYHGDWPGRCDKRGCRLPVDHDGRCAP